MKHYDIVLARSVLVWAMVVVALLGSWVPVMASQEQIKRGEPVSVRAFGGRGNGIDDDTAAFQTALAEIADKPATLVVSGGGFRVGSLVFPEHVTLSVRDGATLIVEEDATVEIHGGIDAGLYRIFDGAGRVAGAPKVMHVYPQWFGARGDGVADDARPLQQAADLAQHIAGGLLFIPDGEYLFLETVALRCNVECHGLLVKSMEIDEARTQFSNDLFLPTHYLKQHAELRFEPDHSEVEISMEPLYGIAEGDLTLQQHRDVPLADGSGSITLREGGTLRLYSSDFFSSRNVRKGAHYYDRNDICQIVSGRGDVFPEFAFSYDRPSDAPAWQEDAQYVKGDYCTANGEVFKATWASGPGSGFTHRHFGAIEIGPVPPRADADDTTHAFQYADGTADSILLWRRVRARAWYRPKDKPLTVRGLRVEARLENHGGETKRIESGVLVIARSNMTLDRLEAVVRDPEATLSRLVQSVNCVNVTFNNGYFSGATSAHLGYNLLNSNVANFRYNDCISTNSRKGMDGRHGKNITVSGGFYNVIDDHYGRNYTIRDITLTGLSVFVPNDSTPAADLQRWRFGRRSAMNFNGANFQIENITVVNGGGGVLGARSDIGDLYGDIVLRDISIRSNSGDVQVFSHRISADFDYAHDVRVPGSLVIDNVRLENPGSLHFTFGSGFGERPYGPVRVSNTRGIRRIYTASPDTTFSGCLFNAPSFDTTDAARLHFFNNHFQGSALTLNKNNLGRTSGNTSDADAKPPIPLDQPRRRR